METIQQVKSVSGKNFPEKKIRAGAVVATIWANSAVNKDGEQVSYKTISFERTYKDKNNEWQTTNSLRMNDLPKATLVLTKAYEHLALSEKAVEEEA
ncbi:hypothetical protein HQ533_01475 [Candidatus Woesearchaeota archaeon]|nr:hypothetical protein [Candidatus Woesearchaeota archaeon]